MEITKGLTSSEQLEHYLDSFQIPIQQWGQNEAKTVNDLYREITSGEAYLEEYESGEMLRVVRVIGVNVYFEHDSGGVQRLIEDRQEFADGRIRRRNMGTSLAEKLRQDEAPGMAAVQRTLKEELGLDSDSITMCEHVADEEKQGTSQSYPGLSTRYAISKYMVILGEEAFNPAGYIEVQETKQSFFRWEAVQD